jgi:PAS domain S-box-containing protein
LSDPDLDDAPIVYANKAFETMTGYCQEEIVGRNCRFLQGIDRDQAALPALRAAIAERQAIEVTLRNYRKSGELFHNRLNIRPLFDTKGAVIYFLGVQYDISEQVAAETEIARLNSALSLQP